jgi:hypothetical protein
MSYIRKHLPPTEPAEPSDAATCIFLRSKAIYVTGEREPGHHDEDGSHFCWCNQTQRHSGPDGLPVLRSQCTPARACYQLTR